MKKTKTIEHCEPVIICKHCGDEVDGIECSNQFCEVDDGNRHCFYDENEVIYCDEGEHYCKKCGDAMVKNNKRKKK